MPFLDRREAGRRLVERLRAFRGPDTVVLGLPCGGVPVAFEVAGALRAPLDVAVVCKLEVPDRPRLVFGAVAESGVRVVDDDLVVRAFIAPPERARVERRARETVLRNSARLRQGRPQTSLAGRTVILVDDGVTTGSTARAACALVRARGAARVVFAVPVGSCRPIRALTGRADNVICLETPTLFHSIGQWYRHFDPVAEETVRRLLAQADDELGDRPPTQPIPSR
ncbi:phosphoribosyltransferase [Nocardia sp. BMG51109]|uniref:phosphoribosyltransferase n=1 Tax=Nocardia sp. BMG51109 TaxID=1056816 RepID=UPI000464F3AF|nr:phosphoribosyltransferase family protein [Nocardia sp. BMG51109]